jgi:hypothetical protein
MQFSHVINPFTAKPGSVHDVAQTITYAALRNALREAGAHGIEAELLGVSFLDEAAAILPPAIPFPVLKTHVDDVAEFPTPAPYPLVREVLALGWEHGAGEYLVFTNMDICPQPYYYRALAELVREHPHLPLVITRRTIDGRFNSADQLAEMYRERGISHEGFDCFVFPREWTPKLDLGALCLGIPYFDYALIMNLEVLSGFKTRIFWNQFLTFHIGDDKVWNTKRDLQNHNTAEATAIADRLAARAGGIPLRSKFEWLRTWMTQEPAPRAPFLKKLAVRVAQQRAEYKASRVVRPFRKALKLASW